VKVAARRIRRTATIMAVIVAGILMVPTGASAATAPPAAPNVVCQYDETYSPSSRTLQQAVVGFAQYEENNTGVSAKFTMTSLATGTVSMTVSTSGAVKASVIVGSVESTYGLSLSTSLSITQSSSVEVTIPAHSHMYASYGVWRVVTPGTYHMFAMSAGCTSKSYSATAKTPNYIGWRTWQ